MIRAAAFCLAALGAVPALAQEITVRGGEHGSFTRLVFELPDGADWDLQGPDAAGRASLVIDGGRGFDLDEAFDRIDRNRVAALAPGARPGSLSIDLACPCDATAFTVQGLLAVDFAERPPGAAPRPLAAPQPIGADDAARRAFSEVRFEQFPSLGPRRTPTPPLLFPAPARDTQTAQPGVAVDNRPVTADESPANAPQIVESELSRQLARAATAGLLSASTIKDRNTSVTEPVSTQANTPDPGPDGPMDETVSSTSDLLRQALEGATSADGRVRIGGTRCIGEAALDLAAWGTDGEPFEAIAAARTTLYGEFDRIDRAAVGELARLYLHYGFGAEAKSVLLLDPEPADPTLVTMARVIDGAEDTAGRFAGQSGCDTPAALWAVLGQTSMPSDADINEAAILRAFEALPRHLKPYIGGRLAERMTELGRPEAARAIFTRLQRLNTTLPDEVALGQARLAVLDGAISEARTTLETLSENGGPVAADAIAARVELASRGQDDVPETYVDLTAALAAEHRGLEEEPELWLAHQRTRIATHDFASVFDAVSNRNDMTEQARNSATEEAFRRLTDTAPDVEFLKLALHRADLTARVADPSVHFDMAQRLLTLGFADAALDMLDRSPAARPREARLRAEALIALGRAQEAEVALGALTDPEAQRLRAQARAAMGDHASAGAVYADLGSTEDARDAAWLAGDWRALGDDESQDALSRAARLFDAPPPDLPGVDPSLAGAEELANLSTETRATLRSLLEETALSSPPATNQP